MTQQRFGSCWELGCSVGELTAALATRCDQILATDGNARAVTEARARVKDFPQVRVEQQIHPEEWPDECFDLIVFSELGYNFEEQTLREIASRLRRSLLPSGTLVACHWRHPIENCSFGGDEVHRIIAESLALPKLVHHAEADFLLEIWSANAKSVAAREGLLT